MAAAAATPTAWRTYWEKQLQRSYETSMHAMLIDMDIVFSRQWMVRTYKEVAGEEPDDEERTLFTRYPGVLAAAANGGVGRVRLDSYGKLRNDMLDATARRVIRVYFTVQYPADVDGRYFLDWLNMRRIDRLCALQPAVFRPLACNFYTALDTLGALRVLDIMYPAVAPCATTELVLTVLFQLGSMKEQRPLFNQVRRRLSDSFCRRVSCQFQLLGPDHADRMHVVSKTDASSPMSWACLPPPPTTTTAPPPRVQPFPPLVRTPALPPPPPTTTAPPRVLSFPPLPTTTTAPPPPPRVLSLPPLVRAPVLPPRVAPSSSLPPLTRTPFPAGRDDNSEGEEDDKNDALFERIHRGGREEKEEIIDVNMGSEDE